MPTPTQQQLEVALAQLKVNQQYRKLSNLHHYGRLVSINGRRLVNMSSNDYLGLGSNIELHNEFIEQLGKANDTNKANEFRLGSVSSRLLTGNSQTVQQLEDELVDWYRMGLATKATSTTYRNSIATFSALVINSGYHTNIGILPALATLPIKTLIVADKYVHASLIDGLRLSQNKYCSFKRYRHNDYKHLKKIIAQAETAIERIIIVTESVFSMDGDRANLKTLVNLKLQDNRIELYVDEAHAVGVLGDYGLGLSEVTQTINDIDYLVGTFGKAFASMGAYVICQPTVREWLINQMRSFIFSTALPPINHSWTRFILTKMPSFISQRQHLEKISTQVSQTVNQRNHNMLGCASNASSRFDTAYQSPIIPYIVGDNTATINKSEQLRQAGFYALPIRPPTVPANTARIRLVMTATLTSDDCERLIDHL